ncbi:N-6 DNA methylase [Thermoactinospora rubra]|uniref:N-6 DNA methylase n=1 Tax=Thermoactinospora rubra TaxID=1088767 RepID=UPI00197EC9D8|nr:N-6 DNA methylase [Thermoactinospora rubra]
MTLAEIARISGVGRAAVSNWRRRHRDFPAPVGGTDASPQFSLSEVEAWLDAHGKGGSSAGALERLWPEYDVLADRDRMGRIIAAFGALIGADDANGGTGSLELTSGELDAGERSLLDRTLAVAQREGNLRTFRFLLDRWHGTHVRQIVTTAGPLAALMAEIAEVAGPQTIETVLDPACGTGGLLLAGAQRWSERAPLRLYGQDRDPVLACLAQARLALETTAEVTVRAADTLRADQLAEVAADVILCSPPTNDRDWGHSELATDRRWVFGQPPRTEPELAWVQHVVSALGEGGVGVVLLPPGVAFRRAGRRIRASLLRAGALRAVIALPPGSSPPYGIGLQLWILHPPKKQVADMSVLMVDTADLRDAPSNDRTHAVDWAGIRGRILAALRGEAPEGSVRMPIVELLGEETDLTPARYLPSSSAASLLTLRRSWGRFDAAMQAARDLGCALRGLSAVREPDDLMTVTVSELEQADALSIAVGQAIAGEHLRRGDRPADGIPVLHLPDLKGGRTPQSWMSLEEVERLEEEGRITVTSSHDVVVAGTVAEFAVWVDSSAPVVLGPHLYRLRPDLERLDPWFLAACLRTQSNARQAGTRATAASRIDVRRLKVLRLPMAEQRRYGEAHRRLVDFERAVAEVSSVGAELGRTLSELLGNGRLMPE